MGEQYRRGNVVRGDFRRGRGNGPGGTDWVSAEAYRLLTPEEKLALAARRQLRGHDRRYGQKPARFRKGYYARQRWTWFAGVCLFGALAGWNFDFWLGDNTSVAPDADIQWGETQRVPQATRTLLMRNGPTGPPNPGKALRRAQERVLRLAQDRREWV